MTVMLVSWFPGEQVRKRFRWVGYNLKDTEIGNEGRKTNGNDMAI